MNNNNENVIPKLKKLNTFLIVLLCISLFSNIVVISMSYDGSSTENLDNENAMQEKNLRISQLNSKISDLENTNGYYDSELDYFMNNAVFVTKTGDCYHKKCCHYIDDREIWIYNVENAINQGYRACSECFGSDYDWRDHL